MAAFSTSSDAGRGLNHSDLHNISIWFIKIYFHPDNIKTT